MLGTNPGISPTTIAPASRTAGTASINGGVWSRAVVSSSSSRAGRVVCTSSWRAPAHAQPRAAGQDRGERGRGRQPRVVAVERGAVEQRLPEERRPARECAEQDAANAEQHAEDVNIAAPAGRREPL